MQHYTDLHWHTALILTHACKAISNHKMNCLKINDTDSESNNNADGVIDLSRPWLNKWSSYFKHT